jgi:microcystin-dependent protein
MAFDADSCPPGWAPYGAAAGRAIIGVTSGGGGISAYARGQTVGAEAVTLGINELPNHSHSAGTSFNEGDGSCGNQGAWNIDWNALGGNVIYGGCSNPQGPFGAGVQNAVSVAIGATGNGQPFSVMQPSLALLYCKKQ